MDKDPLNMKTSRIKNRTVFHLEITPHDTRAFSDIEGIMRYVEEQEAAFRTNHPEYFYSVQNGFDRVKESVEWLADGFRRSIAQKLEKQLKESEILKKFVVLRNATGNPFATLSQIDNLDLD